MCLSWLGGRDQRGIDAAETRRGSALRCGRRRLHSGRACLFWMGLGVRLALQMGFRGRLEED